MCRLGILSVDASLCVNEQLHNGRYDIHERRRTISYDAQQHDYSQFDETHTLISLQVYKGQGYWCLSRHTVEYEAYAIDMIESQPRATDATAAHTVVLTHTFRCHTFLNTRSPSLFINLKSCTSPL